MPALIVIHGHMCISFLIPTSCYTLRRYCGARSDSDRQEMCPPFLPGREREWKDSGPARMDKDYTRWCGETHKCCIDPADKRGTTGNSRKCQVPRTEMKSRFQRRGFEEKLKENQQN